MADDDADGDGAAGAPLADLAERIRARRADDSTGGTPTGESDGSGNGPADVFEAQPFEAVEADPLESGVDAEAHADAGTGGPSVSEADEHVVPKRSYCESCEYFSQPPAVDCGHPGTAIVEFVDIDHVRVRNCPVVAERRALDEADEERMTPGSFGRQ